MDALGTELGVGWLATELEFSLLAVVGALSTGMGALVPGGAGYTCVLRVLSTHTTTANSV